MLSLFSFFLMNSWARSKAKQSSPGFVVRAAAFAETSVTEPSMGASALPTCSSWIWKSLWTQTPTFGWSDGSAGTSQSADGTLKASSSSTTSLWSQPLSSTLSRPWGWLILLCREVRQSDFLTTRQPKRQHFYMLLTVLQRKHQQHLVFFFPPRWWEYGGHWSDSPACSQSAGGGEEPKHWLYTRGWRHHVSESCNAQTERETSQLYNNLLQAKIKSQSRTFRLLSLSL